MLASTFHLPAATTLAHRAVQRGSNTVYASSGNADPAYSPKF